MSRKRYLRHTEHCACCCVFKLFFLFFLFFFFMFESTALLLEVMIGARFLFAFEWSSGFFFNNRRSKRGSALWSGRGGGWPERLLCRVVSHHAPLITDVASPLAARQALPSSTTLHASDNFISPAPPCQSTVIRCFRRASKMTVLTPNYTSGWR